MATQAKNVLVFGGTGVIGKFLVQELVNAKDNFGRIAIFTSQNTLDTKHDVIAKLKSDGVEVFAGDLKDHAYLKEVLGGAGNGEPFDTIVNAFGRNAILEQIPLLDLAETTTTVKRFFPSEYGTDIEYDETSPPEPPHQLKLKVRAHIKNNIRRLEYTYLVTGPYSDLYLGPSKPAQDAGAFVVPEKKAVLLYDGNGPVSLTNMTDVGKLLVAALKHPEVSRNRALKVNSFTATPNEIVKEFERQTESSWNTTYVSREDLLRSEKEAYAKESPVKTLYTLRRIWGDGKTLYKKRDNEELGFTKTQTLAEAVKQSIEQQTTS
jgi:nucleoside-diphosphate-sugar epimerase